MYIKRLYVKNLRSILESELKLRYPGGPDSTGPTDNVNLLLGDNGTGKTTLLGGITLVVLSRVLEGSGFRPYSLVRRGAEEEGSVLNADLVLHAEDLPEAMTPPTQPLASQLAVKLRGTHHLLEWRNEASKDSPDDEAFSKLYDDKGMGWVILGYGATRRVQQSDSWDQAEREKSRSVRFRRVANLFEEHLAMAPLAAWFPQLPGARKAEVTDLLNKMLPDEISFPGKRSEDGSFVFTHEGTEVPFGALSDGYRAYVALVTDILYNLNAASRAQSRLDQVPGIVLIDEIDLHLHPSWQRQVLAQLATSLPRLQFIVSSHSAIVAGTVPDDSLFVLQRQEDGSVKASNPQESIYGKTADEILLSSYFGLRTTRAPGVAKEMLKLSLDAMSDPAAATELLRKMAMGGQKETPVEAPVVPQLRTPPSVREAATRLTVVIVLEILAIMAWSVPVFFPAFVEVAAWKWLAVGGGGLLFLVSFLILWTYRAQRQGGVR